MTVDGLGGEELGQAGSQASNLWMTGSLVTQSDIQVAGNISGAGNAQFGASISGTKFNATTFHGTNVSGTNIVNSAGKLRSTAVDNATTLYGYQVRAGSVTTDDAGKGVIDFKTDMTNANYFLTLTARDYTLPGISASGETIGASGTRRASGLEVYGPSGTTYDWIAVGM